jgi:hypothetical protein
MDADLPYLMSPKRFPELLANRGKSFSENMKHAAEGAALDRQAGKARGLYF